MENFKNPDARANAAADRYGPGIYFAEDPELALQYVGNDLDGYSYMFLSRVLLGNNQLEFAKNKTNGKNVTTTDSEVVQVAQGYGCDSVVVDRNRAEPTEAEPREFIVFDNAQVYPEYLVVFRGKIQPGAIVAA